MPEEINNYITNAREKHLSDEEITDQLLEIGWSKEQIVAAFAQASNLPVPPPPPPIAPITMLSGVLYILFFISLYVLALAISGIFHAWIDNPVLTTIANGVGSSNTSSYDLLPIILSNYFTSIAQIQLIQAYLAAILVSYPLFLLLAIVLKLHSKKQPYIKNLRLYKILVFITLIGTFTFMVSEAITIGFEYFSGDAPFIAFRHLLVTILIAGSIFVYFFIEVKMHGKRLNKDIPAVIYITFFAILALVYGFSIIPSPTLERGRTDDHKRIIALGQIKDTIDDYYQNHSQLPQTLNNLNYNADVPTGKLNKVDPETNQQYTYTITSPTDYKLCAHFSTNSSKDTDPNGYDDANGDYSNFISQFAHPIGYHCFDENELDNSSDSDNNDYDNSDTISPTPVCTGDCANSLVPTPTASPLQSLPTAVPVSISPAPPGPGGNGTSGSNQ